MGCHCCCGRHEVLRHCLTVSSVGNTLMTAVTWLESPCTSEAKQWWMADAMMVVMFVETLKYFDVMMRVLKRMW